jgi:hypothetical protein
MPVQPQSTWFIYTLADPRAPNVIRYVGWTLNVKRRIHQHLTSTKTGRDQTYCGQWKRSLLKAGVTPLLTVIETGNGDGWITAETFWIRHYRKRFGASLTNHTEGGEGFRAKHTDATKLKMSAAQKGRPKNRSPEHTTNLMAALQQRQWSAETRAQMRAAHLGKKATIEHKANISRALKAALSTPEAKANKSAAAKAAAIPTERAARSARLKALWADPQTRANRIAAQRNGHAKRKKAHQMSAEPTTWHHTDLEKSFKESPTLVGICGVLFTETGPRNCMTADEAMVNCEVCLKLLAQR